MRLLIVTQAVDTSDPVLGFFTHWIAELADRCEIVNVICLKEGEHSLPENVHIYSLGKEDGASRIEYVRRFYSYIWNLRHEYDAIFVHMNEEYVLLGGIFWRLLGKRVLMWRNHRAGSWRTRLAIVLTHKVFCTSKYSYTARFAKTQLMPVGINLNLFRRDTTVVREPRSILFLSRISPVKHPEMFIDALGEILSKGISFKASLYGSPLPKDEAYFESLKTRAEMLGLHDRLEFHAGIPHQQTPMLYSANDIFVNCTPSGALDKTLFEAAACGCRVVASSDDFKDAAGEESYAPNTQVLTECLIKLLEQSEDSIERTRIRMEALARAESLATLADRLLLECAN